MGRTTMLAALAILAGCTEVPEARLGSGITAETHERFFPISSGNHAGIDCNACHGAFDTFGKVTCTQGCHGQSDLDPGHAGVGGYAFSNDGRTCLTCHPTGNVQGGDWHERFFPLATHVNQGCADCHPGGDHTKAACSSCHVQNHPDVNAQHKDVGGFGLEDAKCLACHYKAQVDRVADHKPFPITSGNTHYLKECVKCHPQMQTDKPWGIDFKVQSCIGCHDADGNHDKAKTDGQHAGVDGYAYDDKDCLTCHSDGGTHFNHTYFPIDTGSKHASQACSDCHPNSADKKVVSCSTCHLGLDAALGTKHVAVGGYAADDAKCLACHANAQVDTVALHQPFPIQSGKPHYQQFCVKCHPTMRTDKPFGIDFTVQSCIGCHDADGNHDQAKTDAQHVGIDGYAYDDKDCLTCHRDGGSTFDHKLFPIDAASKHTGLLCSDCHTGPDKSTAVCSSCHLGLDAALATKHAAVHDYAADDAGCLRCHGDAQVSTVASHLPFAITAGAPHFQQACLTCHPAFRTDKIFAADFTKSDCIDCHDASGAHDKTPTDAAHVNVSGYTYDTPSCIKCHPDGTFDHSKDFPIDPASKHAMVACTDCHTTPGDYTKVDCVTCHVNREPGIDTSHAQVAQGGDYQRTTPFCEKCHPDGITQPLTVHNPFILQGGPNHHQSCFKCHGKLRADRPFPAEDFKQHTCTNGCHTRDHNQGQDCARCHPDGTNNGN